MLWASDSVNSKCKRFFPTSTENGFLNWASWLKSSSSAFGGQTGSTSNDTNADTVVVFDSNEFVRQMKVYSYQTAYWVSSVWIHFICLKFRCLNGDHQMIKADKKVNLNKRKLNLSKRKGNADSSQMIRKSTKKSTAKTFRIVRGGSAT